MQLEAAASGSSIRTRKAESFLKALARLVGLKEYKKLYGAKNVQLLPPASAPELAAPVVAEDGPGFRVETAQHPDRE